MVHGVGFEPTCFLQIGATTRRHQPLGHPWSINNTFVLGEKGGIRTHSPFPEQIYILLQALQLCRFPIQTRISATHHHLG